MNTFMIVSNVLLWFVFIIQIILFFVLTRSVSEFIKRFKLQSPNGNPDTRNIVLGQKAPLFSEPDHRGDIIALHRGAEHRTLLLFTLDTCVVCEKLIPELPKLIAREPTLRTVAVAQEDLSAPDKPIPPSVSLIRSNRMIELYDVKQVPYFVLIDREGYITDMGLALSMENLIEKTTLKGGDKHVGKPDENSGRFVHSVGSS